MNKREQNPNLEDKVEIKGVLLRFGLSEIGTTRLVQYSRLEKLNTLVGFSSEEAKNVM